MTDWTLASLAAGKVDLGSERVARTGSDLPEPVALRFELDQTTKANIAAAEARFDTLIAQHDMHVSRFPKLLQHDLDRS
jgi:carnitine O-acetyltransferase